MVRMIDQIMMKSQACLRFKRRYAIALASDSPLGTAMIRRAKSVRRWKAPASGGSGLKSFFVGLFVAMPHVVGELIF